MSDSMTQKQVVAAETICAALFGNMVESLVESPIPVLTMRQCVAERYRQVCWMPECTGIVRSEAS